MTTDRDDEYSKFVPIKQQFEIVPYKDKEHYQCSSLSVASDNSCERASRRGTFHQIIATCAVLLLAAACGMPIGYSSVLLPQLSVTNNTNEHSEIPINIAMGSWIASIHSLATPMGSIISGPLADSIGRRTTLLISIVPMCIGWCTIANSQTFFMIIVGRFLCGFAVGILGGPGQVYIAETTEPNLRGLLIGAPFVAYSLGICVVYTLGSSFNWRTVAWCGNILPILASLAIFCIPETPNWLLRHKKVESALRSLSFLRGNEIVAQKELNDMVKRLDQELATTKTNENIFELCCQRVAIKPLIIVITLSLLQMFSGTFIVVFYAIDIISEFGGNFDTKFAAIWTGIVRMVCTIIFCVILLFVRRRRILVLAGIGSGLSCIVLSIYLYTRNFSSEPKSHADVMMAAICLLLYIAFNTPIMVMPGIMVGELFPARIRGRTAGTVFAAMNVALFGFTKAFPYIQIAIKMRGVFMIFAISSFLVSIVMFMFQPETKGRTLEQVEDYFREDNWLWHKRDKSYKQVPNSKTSTEA
ncbi:facilitated trehalose transporter Tret1-2 homolog [Teleopsis dalmanni]|uniref:facilitated trehalose transporter Tret1-2 homolog n=1 Tax=Teleopsis dalmanni TaxID=139649 RepID=UPI0018CF0EA8|nr:facilitated trehalose transporter Tret1-2 homolog [Teleopsis dalmanni]